MAAIWKTPIDLELVNKRNKNTLCEHLRIQFTAVGENSLQAIMPINSTVLQPLGIMHGGASCVLAETVGSTAAYFCVDPQQHYCVGLAINTNHIRSICKGIVTATATPSHLGRSTHVWGIEICNEKEQLISTTKLTMAVLNKKR